MEKTIGQRMKECRKRLGMTQEKLAEIMCVPKTTISTYERDASDIKSSVIIELAKHLETTPNYLLGFTGDSVTEKIVVALEKIGDEKIKEMLYIQVKALVGEM